MQAARGAALSHDPAHDDPAHDPTHDPTEPPTERPAPDAPAYAATPGDPTGDASVVAGPSGPRRALLLAVVALVALALDIVTKVLVVAELEGRRQLEWLGGQLLIRVSRNSGAAFSFAEGYTVVFTAVAIAVVVVIIRVARQLYSAGWAVSLGLLLGGATGNLVDRLLRSPGPGRGAVVDFIDFQVWPSFNVADSAIVTGGVLAVLLSLRGIEVDGTRTDGRSRSQPDA